MDLSRVDRLVLSHGHYDHTGGLKEVLRMTGPIDIIAHPDIWSPRYAVHGATERYIGIPFAREELENLGARFRLSREPAWITESIVTSGEIPMETEYEQLDPHLCVKSDGSFVIDPLADDLAVGVKTELGLVILLGCGHRGMINTIRHLQRVMGEERVHAVLGGTHLVAASPEWLAQASADLRGIGVQRLGVSHCTGFAASCWLANEFPDAFFLNNAGTRFTVP
ncbi:MAG: MBL fold metallo-hydrolase [Chloroflexi bacterium]|nr:MBL fold metallo-hydrolase [Chloroflexota bacterium]